MFRSATFKLTIWYLGLVMAISLIFSVILYNVTTGELNRGLDREAVRIGAEFPVFDNDRYLRPGADYDVGAHRIFLRLVGLNIILFVGAGFASYWLARRTLTPIEEAHEQQKRFTADVSHELRTPLTAIKMESEVALLSKATDKKDLQKTLKSNLEEVGKLEALINNLLRLTRLEADELQQNFGPLNLQKLAANAVDQIASTAKEKRIKLDNQVDDSTVTGDNDSLVQLLVILLDNSVKYSKSGSTVELRSRLAGDEVVISVKDQGMGIEPVALEHVFDRFYRADSSRSKTETEGFGLGLSIAKMIADVHNGRITLASTPGHGTTASVSLPVTKDS
jgi:two-component system, OmpR family, sensor histidine kinase CiaH